MATGAYFVFAALQLGLSLIAFSLWRTHRTLALFTLALPMLALVWDNGAVAIGSFVGAGETLRFITGPRYVGHALLTPIWIFTSLEMVRGVSAETAPPRSLRVLQWALYGAMTLLGVYESLVLFSPVLVQEMGLVYYRNGGNLPGPPVPALVMVATVFVAGVVVWRRSGWPWLALGAVFMFAAAGISPQLGKGFLLDNIGEVALGIAFVATAHRMYATPSGGESPGTS